MGNDVTIIGDGARAISAACTDLNFRRGTCWFHAKQAAKKRMLKKVFDWNAVKGKLNLLQLSSSHQEFISGI
jgi:hypothetical protein